MATFRTHISFGILWAIIISAGSFLYSGINILQAVIVFTLALIGAGIPDIDSEFITARSYFVRHFRRDMSRIIIQIFHRGKRYY